MQFAHNFADRAAHPGLNILDLAFEDVTHHGEQALEHIYAHAGKDFSATARAGVRKWEAGNAMHSRGVSLFSG